MLAIRSLTQTEADLLISLSKKRKSEEEYEFPLAGESITIPIASNDENQEFLIDIHRGKLILKKCTYQERYRKMDLLVRLDINGPSHDNPAVSSVPLPYLEQYNGKNIKCPHMHLYVEGYMDKWAIPAPSDKFTNMDDLYHTMQDFFAYCNVTEKPRVSQTRQLDEY